MQKITINGKTYKYGGWAVCAYEFMLLCNEIASANEAASETELIKIFKKSKELRGKDLLAIVAKKMATYLQNYDAYHNGYIPEITADYIEEFANSDSMQVDIEILTNIIQAIQKLYLHLKIPFLDSLDAGILVDTSADTSVDTSILAADTSILAADTSILAADTNKATINYIEKLQYLLIKLCINHI